MGDGTVRIGYHSFAEYAALSASSTATGYDVDNIRDRLRFTFWRSEESDDPAETQWVQMDLGEDSADDELLGTLVSAGSFNGTADNTPIQPGSFTCTCTGVSGADDGAGNITGTGITAGTINYSTGAIALSFDAPKSGNLTCDYDYDIAIAPDYLCVTDFRDALSTSTPVNIYGGPDGSTWDWSVTPATGTWHPVEWVQVAGAPRRRYWRVEWGEFAANDGRQITISNLLFGKALVLSEGMAQGVDPGSFESKGKGMRTRAGVHLGATIDPPLRHFKLNVGPAGLAIADFDEGGSGLRQTPSLDRYLKSYHATKRPVALRWDGPRRVVGWAQPEGKAATPHVAPLRCGLKLEWDLDPDGYAVRDV